MPLQGRSGGAGGFPTQEKARGLDGDQMTKLLFWWGIGGKFHWSSHRLEREPGRFSTPCPPIHKIWCSPRLFDYMSWDEYT